MANTNSTALNEHARTALNAIDIDVSTAAATLCGVEDTLRTCELTESEHGGIICMLADVVRGAKDKLNAVQPRLMGLMREAKGEAVISKEGGAQ